MPEAQQPAAAAVAARGAAKPRDAASPRRTPVDAHILKFSRDGKFLRQIGKPGVTEGNASKTSLNRPAELEIDAAANELYVADGHGNRRVVVLDATTRRVQAALGRLRRGAGRHEPLRRTIRRRRRQSSSARSAA